MTNEVQEPLYCPNHGLVAPVKIGPYIACNGIVDYSEGKFDPICEGCWLLDKHVSEDLFGPEDRREWSAAW